MSSGFRRYSGQWKGPPPGAVSIHGEAVFSVVQWHQILFSIFFSGCPTKNGPSPKKGSLFSTVAEQLSFRCVALWYLSCAQFVLCVCFWGGAGENPKLAFVCFWEGGAGAKLKLAALCDCFMFSFARELGKRIPDTLSKRHTHMGNMFYAVVHRRHISGISPGTIGKLDIEVAMIGLKASRVNVRCVRGCMFLAAIGLDL